MSNALRQMVEITDLKPVGIGFAAKSVLLHIADTVRDGDGRYWRSYEKTARRLGTDAKTIRRNFELLRDAELIACIGERYHPNGTTNYLHGINVVTLMELPSLEQDDPRDELLEKHRGHNRELEPVPPVSRDGVTGTESTPNQRKPYPPMKTAKKAGKDLSTPRSARDIPAHLEGNAEFAEFLRKEIGQD